MVWKQVAESRGIFCKVQVDLVAGACATSENDDIYESSAIGKSCVEC